MKVQPFNPFPQASLESVDDLSVDRVSPRARRARISTRVLAAVLAIAFPLLQVAPAVASEQVLEIPQVIANPGATHSTRRSHSRVHRHVPDLYDTVPASNADATAGPSDPAPPPATVAGNTESYRPDPNVGSIDDYQNQPGANGQRPAFAFGGGGRRPEPASMTTTDLIIGGIILGVVALEIASHHHGHR